MKRFHVRLCVDDLVQSARFYRAPFAAAPTVSKPDHTKWIPDDPRVNFAFATRSGKSRLDHLGIQVETPDQLHEVYHRLQLSVRPVLDEGTTNV